MHFFILALLRFLIFQRCIKRQETFHVARLRLTKNVNIQQSQKRNLLLYFVNYSDLFSNFLWFLHDFFPVTFFHFYSKIKFNWKKKTKLNRMVTAFLLKVFFIYIFKYQLSILYESYDMMCINEQLQTILT